MYTNGFLASQFENWVCFHPARLLLQYNISIQIHIVYNQTESTGPYKCTTNAFVCSGESKFWSLLFSVPKIRIGIMVTCILNSFDIVLLL